MPVQRDEGRTVRRRVKESDVVKALKRECKKSHIRCIKVASVGERGMPDFMLLGPGSRIGFIETKAPGRLSGPMQVRFQGQLSEAGVFNEVLYRAEDAEDVIDEYYRLTA